MKSNTGTIPAQSIYLHVANTMQLKPGSMALIAAHDWDTAGANQADWTAGVVIRGAEFSTALPPPDVISRSLPETVHLLLALPR